MNDQEHYGSFLKAPLRTENVILEDSQHCSQTLHGSMCKGTVF